MAGRGFGVRRFGPVIVAPLWLAARGNAQAVKSPIADSTEAVATACAVVLALRPPRQRYRCEVEAYQETPTEFVVRLQEQVPEGAPPLVFARSVVRFSKAEPSVTVRRVPEF